MYNDNNFFEKLKDKQFRKKILMIFYLILILFLAYLIKKNPNPKNNIEVNKEKENIIEKEKDERFKLLNNNNYNFHFTLNYNNLITTYEGKRYNNKYSFVMKRNEESSTFIGTEGLLKINNNETVNIFPYYLINYFDNNTLESILKETSKNEDIYVISNKKLSKVLKIKEEVKAPDFINKITLQIKNNYITEMTIDYTEYAKEFDKEAKNVKISLKFTNFYIVDDF